VPIYAFSCERCGGFDAWRPVAEASASLECPDCGTTARRCFTPPGVARTPAPLRAARDRDARSAHEPEVVGAPGAGRPLPVASGHRH
jgi:putative FmdB family regulatory protein